MKPKPQTKAEKLAEKLEKLAKKMMDVGAEMEYYGGFGEMAIHGRELIGAGRIARSWVKEINK